MGVDHGCFDILVSQQFLHGANIIAILQKMRGETVAKSVASHSFLNPCQLHRIPDCPLDACFV
jgi:hypothetical protein